MNLWLRVRRVPAVFAVATAVIGFVLFVRDTAIPLPSVFADVGVPVALLMPLALAIALAWALAATEPRLEITSTRPLPMLDSAFVAAVGSLAFLGCALVGILSEGGLAVAAGRNAVGYLGLLLIGRLALSLQGAATLVAVFVFLVSLFGRATGQEVHAWAWPLARSGSEWTLALTAGILAAGLLLMATGRLAGPEV